MKVLILLCLLFAIALGATDLQRQKQFLGFQRKFKKSYAHDEFNSRFQIFKANLEKAEELTRRETGTARFGVTKFSDLTEEEFTSNYLMPKSLHANPESLYSSAPLAVFNKTVPPTADFDWKSKGAVSAVYNQQQCGSCWAFSATETVESYWKLAGHTLDSLSPQQVVDCDKTSYGCSGGWTEHAFEYLTSHGQEKWSSYPYQAVDGTCKFNAQLVDARIHGYKYVTQSKNENDMLSFVTAHGPLSVCVDASTWSSYQGGVLRTCGKSIDHCVQITGYSTQSGLAAWNVRNSWGADWGESGYIYVFRGQDVCAIAEDVTVPTV